MWDKISFIKISKMKTECRLSITTKLLFQPDMETQNTSAQSRHAVT